MERPLCPYCRIPFNPSRYHPDQIVCSGIACQRQRRADYHRGKLLNDPSYREQCSDSQGKWPDEHPDYMRDYRKKNGRASSKTQNNSTPPEPSETLLALLDAVKKNLALEVTSRRAAIWVISSNQSEKNILADAEVIVIEEVP